MLIQKKIYADTKSLIFQGYGIAGCPILRYVVLHQTINFNYSLLVAPSFANGGNLFILPIIFQYYINQELKTDIL